MSRGIVRLVTVLGSMGVVGFTSMATSVGRSAEAAARTRRFASITVTPDGQSSGSIYANSSGHTAQFTLDYTGNELDPEETLNLFCTGTLGIQCSVQSTIAIYPNGQENVDVTFSTSSQTGTGTVSSPSASTGRVAH